MGDGSILQPLGGADPQSVGDWKLLGRLGAGGMGVVYLAARKGGQRAALKVIHAGYAHDPNFRARFKREVHASRAVHGRYVADVIDAETDGDLPWLATAYIPGPTLNAYVDEYGPLPNHLVGPLAAGLLEGLATIHDAGIVHRDLKPSNVLLTEDAPIIIDFGVATAADSTSLTGTGLVVGSAGWMAPEQLRGEPAGPPADVFAWAALVAFAATGRPPFGTGRPDALGYRVAHEAPDLDGVVHPLRRLLEGALAKDPAARPDLSELRSHLGVGAPATVETIAASWEAPTQIATLVGSGRSPASVRPLVSWRSVGFVASVVLVVAASVGAYLLGRPDSTSEAEGSPTPVAAQSQTSTSTTKVLTTAPVVTLDDFMLRLADLPEGFTIIGGAALWDKGTYVEANPCLREPDVVPVRDVWATFGEPGEDPRGGTATGTGMEFDSSAAAAGYMEFVVATFEVCTGYSPGHSGQWRNVERVNFPKFGEETVAARDFTAEHDLDGLRVWVRVGAHVLQIDRSHAGGADLNEVTGILQAVFDRI